MKSFEEDSPHPTGRGRSAIPTIAILHVVDTSSGNRATSYDDDHNDQNQNYQQEHEDNEPSDDNSMAHAELDETDENPTDTD